MIDSKIDSKTKRQKDKKTEDSEQRERETERY